MTGRLAVVGLGPGGPEHLTAAAAAALAEAEDLVGYAPYLARVPERSGQARHASDNREERARAETALALAAAGRRVAVVSSGDPGVFAMAAAVFEALEAGPPAWRGLDIRVLPGVTAMLAAAAAAGAPLGHDFCAINLSDNLKPWALIERRLRAAAEGDFVIALYNPRSRARPDGLARAFDLLRGLCGPDRPVLLARAVTTPEETLRIVRLGAAQAEMADMRTLVIVGSARSRVLDLAAGPRLYTPRSSP
ncbi:MAG: precorrin-3B C(17)-methyltransferase [Rhodobacteraceae bacterium]|nr:precorrin-3B C(17)-methyltransferase [Paracoccaceae bacterium]